MKALAAPVSDSIDKSPLILLAKFLGYSIEM